MQMIEERANLSLISQFNVSFFSLFLISDRTFFTSSTMMTTNASEKEASESFKIMKNELDNNLIHKITTLYLKKDLKEIYRIKGNQKSDLKTFKICWISN
jgi:molecular chaperone HtpG